MKFKKLITLIETLALTGLVSVGFSSWLIIETNPAILQGRVNVEEVYDNNDYLTIKNMSFSDYCNGGFYDDYKYGTESLTNPGVLEFDIVINLNKYREELKTSPSSVELDIQLSYYEQIKFDDEGNPNFLDIITRSLSSTSSDDSLKGSFNSIFSCKYDNNDSNSFTKIIQTKVAYSNETPSPNIDTIIRFDDISNVSSIVLSSEYIFMMDKGFVNSGFTEKDNDYFNLYERGIPFKIYSVLEND